MAARFALLQGPSLIQPRLPWGSQSVRLRLSKAMIRGSHSEPGESPQVSSDCWCSSQQEDDGGGHGAGEPDGTPGRGAAPGEERFTGECIPV